MFLWADEAQYFVTTHDLSFQQTARACRAATVYLTQSLPNYHAALRGGGGHAFTDSLLACLQTKVFHANSDVVTNEWAERLFGHVTTYEANFGASLPAPTDDPKRKDRGHTESSGFQPVRIPRIPAHEFATLQAAGPDQPAQAFVFVLGKDWRAHPGALAWRETFTRHPDTDQGVYPA